MTRIRELVGISWADLERPATCEVTNCRQRQQGRGPMCRIHYERLRQHGTTDLLRPPTAIRFWAKVDKNGPVPDYRPDLGPCWLYMGKRNWMGYGNIKIERRWWMAHRWAYQDLIAPVSADLEIDHLCRVRACVNPSHLEPVTNRENALRGYGVGAKNARKTHCLRGHEFTPENIGRMRADPTWRFCKTCRRVLDREGAQLWRDRQRAKKLAI